MANERTDRAAAMLQDCQGDIAVYVDQIARLQPGETFEKPIPRHLQAVILAAAKERSLNAAVYNDHVVVSNVPLPTHRPDLAKGADDAVFVDIDAVALRDVSQSVLAAPSPPPAKRSRQADPHSNTAASALKRPSSRASRGAGAQHVSAADVDAFVAAALAAAAATKAAPLRRTASVPGAAAAARSTLPAVVAADDVISTLAVHDVVVVTGETGCGKSTQIPQLLLDALLDAHASIPDPSTAASGDDGTAARLRSAAELCPRILVAEPRRVAAVALAARVAAERGLTVGSSAIGHAVRGDVKMSDAAQLIYCTAGVAVGAIADEVEAPSTGVLVIDEIHERDSVVDTLLALTRVLRARRPGLKVVLMSATVDAVAFDEFFAADASRYAAPLRAPPPLPRLGSDEGSIAEPALPRPPSSPHRAPAAPAPIAPQAAGSGGIVTAAFAFPTNCRGPAKAPLGDPRGRPAQHASAPSSPPPPTHTPALTQGILHSTRTSVGKLHIPGRTFAVLPFFVEDLVAMIPALPRSLLDTAVPLPDSGAGSPQVTLSETRHHHHRGRGDRRLGSHSGRGGGGGAPALEVGRLATKLPAELISLTVCAVALAVAGGGASGGGGGGDGALCGALGGLPSDGAVLVFVPGFADITAVIKACEAAAGGGRVVSSPSTPAYGSDRWDGSGGGGGGCDVAGILGGLAGALRVCDYVMLHGQMSLSDQKLAFARAPVGRRKVIVSTSLAESSVTIDDVTVVIDTCHTKGSAYDSLNNITLFGVEPTTAASSIQRRGRAGRVRNGVAIHLARAASFLTQRAAYHTAEVTRMKVDSLLLSLLKHQHHNPAAAVSHTPLLASNLSPAELFELYPDPPSAGAVTQALRLLIAIGAVSGEFISHRHATAVAQAAAVAGTSGLPADPADTATSGRCPTSDSPVCSPAASCVTLTPLGHTLSALPVDPLVARALIGGIIFRCLPDALTLAAALSSPHPVFPLITNAAVKHRATAARAALLPTVRGRSWPSEHAAIITAFNRFASLPPHARSSYCWDNFVSQSALSYVESVRKTLLSNLVAARLVSSESEVHGPLAANSNIVAVLITFVAFASWPHYARLRGKRIARAYTRDDGRADITGFIAGHDAPRGESDAVYSEKVRNELGICLRMVTVVPRIASVICGYLDSSDDAEQHSHGKHLSLKAFDGERVDFDVGSAATVRTLAALRRALADATVACAQRSEFAPGYDPAAAAARLVAACM